MVIELVRSIMTPKQAFDCYTSVHNEGKEFIDNMFCEATCDHVALCVTGGPKGMKVSFNLVGEGKKTAYEALRDYPGWDKAAKVFERIEGYLPEGTHLIHTMTHCRWVRGVKVFEMCFYPIEMTPEEAEDYMKMHGVI